MIYDFQIHEIDGNIAKGMFISSDRHPTRDDFWMGNGDEVEFGGGYQELGSFDDKALENAEDLWRHRNDIKTIELPKDKGEFLVGQCLRVVCKDLRDTNVIFKRHCSLSKKYRNPKPFFRKYPGE